MSSFPVSMKYPSNPPGGEKIARSLAGVAPVFHVVWTVPPPQHIHKAEDEAFYVLEGEVDVKRGEETRTAVQPALHV